MPKLSVCIPLDRADADATGLVSSLLSQDDLDLEVVIAGGPDTQNHCLALQAAHSGDKRLSILQAVAAEASEQDLWSTLVAQASGDWICLANPQDMVEPELAIMAAYLDQVSPNVDALGWNALQVEPDAPREKRMSVAIPVKYDIALFSKDVMLKAFFFWENSMQVPMMPFGLFHGMIRKSLATTVIDSLKASVRQSAVPRYEWAGRVLLLSNEIAFCSRPMSAISLSPYKAPSRIATRPDFPFHAGLGIAAAIAEGQYCVLKEMGAEWGGAEEAFVRACMIDCMLEPVPEKFSAKCDGYFAALKMWHGGQFAPLFKPQFMGEQPRDTRRGLHGQALMIDRFIGGAGTAQEFYAVVRSFLAPVRLICGGAAV
jgi:hypothetical protein